ncbi:MAG: hypothetical protein R6V05_02230 [Candidatus Brocadiia bacterium]
MAKHQWLTPHQEGIVRRHYENKDKVAYQKLAELVSELYLCEDDAEATRLWRKARAAMVNAGVHEGRAEGIADARDLDRLAKVVEELS